MRTTNARIAVIYYSSTGTVHGLATALAEGAADSGAEVRLRRAPELAPAAAIDSNPEWRAHLESTDHVASATHDDLVWANGYALGSPTRFGNVSSQLRQFLDTTSGLWERGVMANKPATGFTASYSTHGGQESTLLSLYNTLYHWGALVLPTGYVHKDVAALTGGNPYGVALSQQHAAQDAGLLDAVLDAARLQGSRLAEVAARMTISELEEAAA